MTSLAVFASGSGTNYEAIVQACLDGRIAGRVVLLVCDNPDAYVLERAKQYGTPTLVFRPKDYPSKAAFETEIADHMDRLQVQLVCLAGYMRIIGDTLLERYGGRIINIHPSLLPAFKGKNAVEQAVAYGVKVFGISVHWVDRTLDGGKIIAQRAFEYDGNDPAEVHRLGQRIEHQLYVEAINHVLNGKRVLVVGGGGREHAIVDALARSSQVISIYCAPGNAGIAAQAECVPIADTDIEALKAFALSRHIDLTVVGPEAALAGGLCDAFRQAGLTVFGHTQAATQIESSKLFAKQLMQQYNIPTANYRMFDDYPSALAYVRSASLPCVIKYDGLAAGKGVVVAETLDEADHALRDMLVDAHFGQGRVVIEDYLQGPEFSFMCFVSGTHIVPMPLAQDHKRAFDGDCGPNTGGMGAYTRLPFLTPEDIEFARIHILQATADAMAKEGLPLSGVLYGGLMKTPNGIKVIEFNARFGDPETEVVLPLLRSDIYDLFHAVAVGDPLPEAQWSDDVTMGVVLASKGYPAGYPKGAVIRGLDKVHTKVYHMGTAHKDDAIVTNGGRVLMVVGTGTTLPDVRQKVYQEADKIDCPTLFFRRDIAHQALEL